MRRVAAALALLCALAAPALAQSSKCPPGQFLNTVGAYPPGACGTPSGAGSITPSSINLSNGDIIVGNVSNVGAALVLGSGVQTAIQDAVNATGGFVTYSGQLGTPTQGVATNLTGLPLSTGVTGTLAATNFPALTGDLTTTAGSLATTLATVNASPNSYTYSNITVNAKGLVTAASSGTAPLTSLTGDVTTSSSGAAAATLATVNSNVGNFTSANITVNAKGLVTAAANGSGGGGGITALTGDVTASGSGSVAATLATVNSNTGSFGSTTSIPSFTVNGKGLITAASGNTINVRSQLTGAVTYYVNGSSGSSATCGAAGGSTCSAGSDSNNGLSPSTPFLTLQHAVNVIIGTVDFAQQYGGTIYLAHNTGTTNYDVACVYGPLIGTAVVGIVGDSTSQNATVIQDPASGYGAQVKDGCTLSYQYVEFTDSASNNAAGHITTGAGNYGHVDIANITLGPIASGSKLVANYGGSITAIGPITTSGNSAIELTAAFGGTIDYTAETVTVSGTPAYSSTFAYIHDGGAVSATPSTFSGSATGPRCLISGLANVNGSDPNTVFPGNSNCAATVLPAALPVASGGTAHTTANAGFNALAPTTTEGDQIVYESGVNARVAAGSQNQVWKMGATDPAWGSMRQVLPFGGTQTIAGGATTYCWNQGCGSATQGAASGTFVISGTLKNLTVSVATAPGSGQNFAVTVYYGTTLGSLTATSITCTISNTNTTCSDSTHTQAVAANGYATIQVVASASATSSGTESFGLEFDNP